MDEMRLTDTNAADDTAGRAFGLEGNLYLPVVLAGVGAVALFAVASLGLKVHPLPAGLAAGVPLALVVGWVVLLRNGRSAGFDRDLIEHLTTGGHFSRGVAGVSVGRTHARAPDARFVGGMLVFGSPERGAIVAKGYSIEPPDLRGASIGRLNAFQDQVRAVLASVGPGRRLQVFSTYDSDYESELAAYHRGAGDLTDEVVRRVRNERVLRYLCQRSLEMCHLGTLQTVPL